MGQKIHPTGFRLPVTRAWASRWYASNKNFAQMLAEDLKVREYLKAALTKLLNVPVAVNIEEVRKPEIDAQLIADSITQQLEKRIMFRRAMKRAMQNAMRLGAQGIKIMSSGRLNGIEIARTEWYREGRVPLHTLRAEIDYGTSEALTTYGLIGVKVWVYKGDHQTAQQEAAAAVVAEPEKKVRKSSGAKHATAS